MGAALGLALSACATAPEGVPAPHLALYPTRATHDALVDGRLLTVGSCLFLVARDGTTYGLAWPSGRAQWDPVASAIVMDDARAGIGQDVWIGGGPADVTAQNLNDPRWEWVQPPRVECLGEQFWIASSISTEEP